MFKMTVTQCVAISLNVSFKRSITPEKLVKIFTKEMDWEPWIGHLDVFFDEVSSSMIKKFMVENNLNYEQLAEIYESLPPVWQGKTFREMRDAAMGNSVQESS